jgi:SGNH hydrolase-like domain, acetyltransferase AlgX
MKKWLADNRTLVFSASIPLSGIAVSWVLYGFFGHGLIEAMHNTGPNAIVDHVMRWRSVTPLDSYYKEADRMMRAGTLWAVVSVGAAALLAKAKLLGKVVLLFSEFIFSSLLIFSFFELFPSLIEPFHLDEIGYYTYKAHYLPDDKLAYRYRPLRSEITNDFRGSHYSPLYGVEVAPLKYEWIINEEGFRNSRVAASSDIVVIGDSYVDYGENEADTFGRRLEKVLGVSATNLAVAGYGPFQYLEVLKRYGVKKSPKVAFFSFYEGNDLGDISDYLQWRTTGDYRGFVMLSYGFVWRYISALTSVTEYIAGTIRATAQLISNRLRQNQRIHPDIAVLNLGNGNRHKALLFDHGTRSTEAILESDQGKELRKILKEFKDVSTANNISPIILYLPIASHIYAEYSTEESGKNWLENREKLIAAKANTENAIVRLARELDIELISLTPAFEAAAKEGKLLYYPFDTHWNSEGRAVAAAFVAERLKNRFIISSEKAAG